MSTFRRVEKPATCSCCWGFAMVFMESGHARLCLDCYPPHDQNCGQGCKERFHEYQRGRQACGHLIQGTPGMPIRCSQERRFHDDARIGHPWREWPNPGETRDLDMAEYRERRIAS